MTMREISVHPRLTTGVVTLVSAPDADLLMPAIAVALPEDETVTVVPVSADVRLATDWDLLLDPSVLGYRAIAEVWNYGSVLPEQCVEVVGTVDDLVFAAMKAMIAAAIAGEPAPSGVPIGPAVVADDDPRLLFQDAEAEAVHVFWQPTLRLAGALTLGEVVRHRRDEAEVAARVDALAGATEWLEPLERDELDIARRLPSTTLADLLRHLGLGASARLRSIASTTLQASSPAIARGPASGEPPVDAEAYLDAVFAELEGRA
jgi:hypothetical protein